MQYRIPSGGGPSSNTWPRCPSHDAQRTSARGRNGSDRSGTSRTASGAMGARKLGHPVPESYLAAEAKSGEAQPAHVKTPTRFSELRALLQGRSVAARRNTAYDSGLKLARHSASVLAI